MQSLAEGTLICPCPLTVDHSSYISELQRKEQEQNMALKVNSRIAQLLHGKLVANKSYEHETLIIFKNNYRDFHDYAEDEISNQNWADLRVMIGDKMPETPYHRWLDPPAALALKE